MCPFSTVTEPKRFKYPSACALSSVLLAVPGDLAKIAGVDDQVGGSRKRIDLVDRSLKGSGYVRIRPLVEADVAIADLNEAESIITMVCFVTRCPKKTGRRDTPG